MIGSTARQLYTMSVTKINPTTELVLFSRQVTILGFIYVFTFQFDINHRVLLTGTPVQNNLRELYSLLSFIAPRIFRPSICDEFVDEFEDVSDDKGKFASFI